MLETDMLTTDQKEAILRRAGIAVPEFPPGAREAKAREPDAHDKTLSCAKRTATQARERWAATIAALWVEFVARRAAKSLRDAEEARRLNMLRQAGERSDSWARPAWQAIRAMAKRSAVATDCASVHVGSAWRLRADVLGDAADARCAIQKPMPVRLAQGDALGKIASRDSHQHCVLAQQRQRLARREAALSASGASWGPERPGVGEAEPA